MIVNDWVRPMLSRIMARSLSGTISRMASSTWPKMRSVCSMRVPAGARTCSLICPASTLGKKSWPIIGNKGGGADREPKQHDEREEPVMQSCVKKTLIGAVQAIEGAVESVVDPAE